MTIGSQAPAAPSEWSAGFIEDVIISLTFLQSVGSSAILVDCPIAMPGCQRVMMAHAG